MKIAKLKWGTLDYGTMFKITSRAELDSYFTDCRALRMREGYTDYISSREFADVSTGRSTGNHVSTSEGGLLAALCYVEATREKPQSLFGVMLDLSQKVYDGMFRGIQDHGVIYVNGKGGYFTPIAGMVESSVQEIKTWVFPQADIRIKSWAGGTHFYAYVGDQSVSRYGRNKWDTEAEARYAAEQWAKENGVEVIK